VRRVLLIGMMGSGKSSVGRALAGRTGWRFLDNDRLVKRATGRTPRELLRDEGEDALRAGESAALGEGLAARTPAIIAVAAGVILETDDRRRMTDAGLVVWLDAPPAVLAARAARGEHRPFLDADPAGWLEAQGAQRAPLYAEVADLRIDTSRESPEAAARRIHDVLEA
jgi:shikimate kinase